MASPYFEKITLTPSANPYQTLTIFTLSAGIVVSADKQLFYGYNGAMTKLEIARAVSEKLNITQQEAKQVVQNVLDAIKNTLVGNSLKTGQNRKRGRRYRHAGV